MSSTGVQLWARLVPPLAATAAQPRHSPVGDSRLPSAVTDKFTIKILNSILAETHTANE